MTRIFRNEIVKFKMDDKIWYGIFNKQEGDKCWVYVPGNSNYGYILDRQDVKGQFEFHIPFN